MFLKLNASFKRKFTEQHPQCLRVSCTKATHFVNRCLGLRSSLHGVHVCCGEGCLRWLRPLGSSWSRTVSSSLVNSGGLRKGEGGGGGGRRSRRQ